MIIRSTVTGKNQVTIPAAIALKLRIEPGMQVEWEVAEDDSEVIVRPVLSRAELAQQLQGAWRHLLPPGYDPIAELIREREEEDEDID
jgi:AbrB family looped-hinge helix DNA binding protein